MTRESLPKDFFEDLTENQRVMLKILLDEDGEYIRGFDIREKMREEYGMDIGEAGQPTAGIIGGFTRKYGRGFRDDLIDGKWVDDKKNQSEHRIGDKYKERLREWFDERERR